MQPRRIALAALLLAAVAAASAAAPEGTWHGRISAGLQRLQLVFHFGPDSTCTVDSPDQGARGLAARLLPCGPDSVAVAIPAVQAEYRGRVGKRSITGRFRQGPYVLPLNLKPGEASLRRPQTPVPPFPYVTREVSVPSGDAVLSGTITYPEGYTPGSRPPLAVLVSGSGLQNRDEEIMGHKPFAVLAHELARRGVATLRYDDRGFARSTGSNDSATTMTYADDAAAAVAYARASGDFGAVGVAGHSEGGTIAFILGARGDVDFAVSLAGAAVAGMDILMAQNRRALAEAGYDSAVTEAYCSVLAPVLRGEKTDAGTLESLPEALRANLRAVESHLNPWMRYFATFDPAEALRALKCPLLALNGELDTQVEAGPNLEAIKRAVPAHPRNELRSYPGLNHLFQPCRTGSVAEYGTIEQTMSPAVPADIATWILVTVQGATELR